MAEKRTTKKKVVRKTIGAGERCAVIRIGGGQRLVREGVILNVPRLEGKEGSKFKVEDVFLAAGADMLKIGTPVVRGAEVTLKILEHTKGEKVEIRKFRAKSRYRRKTGHRQLITRVQVEEISPA